MKERFLPVFATVLALMASVLFIVPQLAQADTGTILGATALGNSLLTPGNPIGTAVGSIFGGSGGGLLAGGGQTTAQLAGQAGAVTTADAMCTPFIQQCGCGMIPDPKHPGSCIQGTTAQNMHLCPCSEISNGFTVSGTCQLQTKCLGVNGQSLTGGSVGLSGGSGLGSSLSNLLQATMLASLINGMVNGSGNSSPAAPAPVTTSVPVSTTGTTGCTGSYYDTASPSSDPCAIYTPGLSTSGTTGSAASNLLNALGGTTGNSSGLSSLSSSGSTSNTPTTGTSCPTLDTNCPSGYIYQASTQTDANGCEIAGLCVASSNSTPTQTSCPSVTASCSIGFTAEPSTGTDSNGCALPDQCVASTSTTTPTTPTCATPDTNSCPTGYTYQASTQTDSNGCALAGVCVSSSGGNACPAVSASCTSGTIEEPSSGLDQNGCPLPDECVPQSTIANVGSITLSSTTALAVPSASSPELVQPVAGQGGVSGNIQVTSTGTTFYAVSQNANNNSETASFIGSDTTMGTPPQGIIGNWCATRPWATNFLADLIPPSFFDSLCTIGGYQLGSSASPKAAPAGQTTGSVVNAAAPTPELQQVVQEAPPASSAPAAPATPAPATGPSVEIWAVPATVSIGQRTSIFWNTQGVASCTETSPDGSFSQNTLSGGASTVPLTTATTYTISCLDPNDNPVTSYVTVNIGS